MFTPPGPGPFGPDTREKYTQRVAHSAPQLYETQEETPRMECISSY